jgi:hypothetical protein
MHSRRIAARLLTKDTQETKHVISHEDAKSTNGHEEDWYGIAICGDAHDLGDAAHD